MFEDDRGFLAAVVALASIAKRPIVLTSSRPDVNLPTDAEFLILGFQPPKLEVRHSHFTLAIMYLVSG